MIGEKIIFRSIEVEKKRLYRLVFMRNDGQIIYLNAFPMTHKECMTMKSKNSRESRAYITVQEVEKEDK